MNEASEVIQYLRRTVLLPGGAGMTDGQLLSRFLEGRDEDAFAALVRRHGPMVWGVCRRLLRSHQDAEDAFQATFLVLVRKAAYVRPRDMLANWLYGVASMTAHRGQVAAARARRREMQFVDTPEPAVAAPDLCRDLEPLLDGELDRLPGKYRAVVVLCDLEGNTRKEAARQLGLPEGTVGSRLARARAMLAKRLSRHGLAVSGGSLALVLSQKAASAGVPASVVASTVRGATCFARGSISARVAALTEGVIRSMVFTRLKTATAGLLLLAVTLGTGAGLICQTQAFDRPGKATVEEGKEPRMVVPASQPPQSARRNRILRWTIVFNTRDGKEYAHQLQALGATLAIPTSDQNRYQLICDLSKRPVKTTAEDISRIDHIFMVDANKKSVQSLSKELGLRETPDRIVVFLPRFVEDELLRKELDYLHRPEKDIVETTFRFARTKRGFDLTVTYQR